VIPVRGHAIGKVAETERQGAMISLSAGKRAAIILDKRLRGKETWTKERRLLDLID
jgi:hypothetical protein